MNLRSGRAAVLLLAAAAVPLHAEPDIDVGRDLARTYCARCHGEDGNARSTSFRPVPMLAGQPAVYLVEQMRKYVSGEREGTKGTDLMISYLSGLTDDDFADIAAYFEAQKRY